MLREGGPPSKDHVQRVGKHLYGYIGVLTAVLAVQRPLCGRGEMHRYAVRMQQMDQLVVEIPGQQLGDDGVRFRHADAADLELAVPEPVLGLRHDVVKQPKHYTLLGGEVIALIASSMTFEEFYGYCKGNILKYRLRAGKKDDALQDLAKADEYELLFEAHKWRCKREEE